MKDLEARARKATMDLLTASAALEQGVLIPYGRRTGIATVGLAIRARRLSKAIVALADRGEWLEAQILARTLLEYVITLQWIAKDPDRRVLSWWQADDRSFGTMVREVTGITGQPAELEPAIERQHNEIREKIAAEAVALEAPPYPTLQERARDVDADLGYSLLFRFYSQGGVHPYRQALMPLVEDLPERGAVLMRESPSKSPTDDPYYLAGALLVLTLQELIGLEPTLDLPDLEPSKQEFMAIKHAIDAGGDP